MHKYFSFLGALVLTAALLVVGVAPAPAASNVPDPFLAQVLAAANKVRWANGAGPLTWNPAIATGSQQWATKLNGQINAGTLDMAKLHRTDYGLSILPQGSDMFSEIIGINNTPQQIVDWWMGSPGHRAALLDKRATDIGMGVATTTKAGWNGMTVVVANLAGYPATRATQPQPAPRPVANDGDVAAVDPSGNLFIYGSARGGDMWQRTFVSSGWTGTQQLEMVDLNSDGLQDIVAKWANGDLTVSYGQANGTLTTAVRIGTGWGPYDIVATKWRTTDRFPGIVAKNRTSGDLFYYPSWNGANFSPRLKIGTGWGPLAIMASDFDGDGRMDILARNGAGQLLLYRGNGAGGFIHEARRVVGTGWGSMTFLSGITNHLGDGGQGILARTGTGNLLHYPVLKNGWGARAQVGTGGWGPLLLGS
ncbi:CAP domain-containing protein [Arthrobacter sp. STN4]|uniref:CAP domain-containing protein n=1 Tax=Arthrobacter sp. STN4 TaxID=2923276 RepID=UPI00211A803E|nr:CAP domain-containing protein [Arthrobacter sp. STN4]MCQ9165907.1 CAP domain-containing protein [Arthrobacter sp. STN4]